MIKQVDVPHFNDESEKTFWMDVFHLGMVDGHGVSSSIVGADVALSALHVRVSLKKPVTQSGLFSGIGSALDAQKSQDAYYAKANQDYDFWKKNNQACPLGDLVDPTAPSED